MNIPASDSPSLSLLQSFVTMAEELHVGRAAHRLNVAQPALSRRLQRLEHQLGLALFDRQRRRLHLTVAGQALLTEARALLAHAEAAFRLVRSTARGEVGRLRIGFVEGATASGILPGAVRRLLRDRPGLALELQELPSLAQVDALLRGQIDVGMVFSRPAVPTGLAFRTLLRGRFAAVLSTRHPLARSSEIAVAQLAREPLILWERGINPPRYDAILAALRAAAGGTTSQALHHAVQLQAIVSLAAAGVGVGLVPDTQATMRMQGVAYRPIPDLHIPVDLEVMWREGEGSPVLSAFLVALHAWKVENTARGDDE
jgi:DNA-binding transcriptional LysR family regulator